MTTQERQLLAYAVQATQTKVAKHAVISDLSPIPHIQDPTFFGVLRKRMEAITGKLGALEFELSNHRICYVLDRDAAATLVLGLSRISKLLVDHGKLPIDVRTFDLGRHAEAFHAQCQLFMTEIATTGAPGLDEMSADDENLDRYLFIEENLHSADISSLVREQPIYDFTDADQPRIVAYELSTAIEEIEGIYGVPIRRNPWLFSRVTEILDIRMLKHLSQDLNLRDRTLCINLHVATILGQTFREFAQRTSFGWDGNMIVEFPFIEVMESDGDFRNALDILRFNHALAAIDGIPLEQLAAVPAMPDLVRFLKVRWSDDFAGRIDDLEIPALEQLERFGRERCVITHCETLANVEGALRLGFRVLQGHGVDDSVAELRRQQVDRTMASLEIRQSIFDEPDEEAPKTMFGRVAKFLFGGPRGRRRDEDEI